MQIKNGILQPAEITLTVDTLGTKSQLTVGSRNFPELCEIKERN